MLIISFYSDNLLTIAKPRYWEFWDTDTTLSMIYFSDSENSDLSDVEKDVLLKPGNNLVNGDGCNITSNGLLHNDGKW